MPRWDHSPLKSVEILIKIKWIAALFKNDRICPDVVHILPNSPDRDNTMIRQWTDDDGRYPLDKCRNIGMIKYCRNVVLSPSAVLHCIWHCQESIVSCSVIVGNLTWASLPNSVLITGLSRTVLTKLVHINGQDAIWDQSAKTHQWNFFLYHTRSQDTVMNFNLPFNLSTWCNLKNCSHKIFTYLNDYC